MHADIGVHSFADPSIGTVVEFSEEKARIGPADKGTAGRLHSAEGRADYERQELALRAL
jgi:hypothetical protein